MKKIKFIIAIIILSFVIFPFSITKADGTQGGNSTNASSLNKQLYIEIKEVLNLPVYLAFEDKNLKGDAYVTIKVDTNGKLVIAGIHGKNQTLNRYLQSKISSKNLWTPKKFSQEYFRYRIHIK
ncbi:MAG: hypothetical protein HY959_10250 [Ignavibacteriae bacterium]|nr:hypothetical protein [Ignavibacteriota bacterium]